MSKIIYVNNIPITIEYRNVKNINLYIKPPDAHVLITAPRQAAESRIREFAEGRAQWIEKSRKRMLDSREKMADELSGAITKEQMEAVLGEEVLVSPAILEKLKDGEVARSPGMKYKHYAPKAQVTILRGDFAKYKEFIKQHTEPGVWALCFDGEGAQLGVPFIEYGKNHDGVTQAHHLFTALRDLDKHGAQVVYARCPEQDGVSMAVYNRLIRAAAFRVVEL